VVAAAAPPWKGGTGGGGVGITIDKYSLKGKNP
jgi:hypothetical protein